MEDTPSLKIRVTWSLEQINREKQSIKRELSHVKDAEARLKLILDSIADLEDLPSSNGQLRRYIYIVSALVHHDNFGGLNMQQGRKLTKLADAILKTQGIKPSTSLLSFLYSEVHLALSHLYRKEGSHWMSAWEQQYSHHLSLRNPPGGRAFQNFIFGIRSLRLGFSELAVNALQSAEKEGIPDASFVRARLERVRAMRFSGDIEGAKLLANDTLANDKLTPTDAIPFSWELISMEVGRGKEVDHLLHHVRSGRSHHEEEYLIQTFLYSRAVFQRDWIKRFPTVKTMARNPKLKFKTKGFFHKCAMALIYCYDYEVPFSFRLHHLGTVLSQTDKLLSVDQELLVWAAAIRWLVRSRAYSMAALAISQYQGLSYRLSNGKLNDSLGILQDLMTKDWIARLQESEAEETAEPVFKKAA